MRGRGKGGRSAALVRLFDVAGATLIGVVTAPLWMLVAAGVRLTEGSPVLHSAVRVGRDGAPFVLLKFRTMRPGPTPGSTHGPRITSATDRRITRLGAWLRRTKVDELPQLWNVVRGDMSLVGPRPEDPLFVGEYSDDQIRLLSVRPGLTSPATIAYRHEAQLLTGYADPERAYVEEVLPNKLSIDLAWLDHRTVRGDVGVLFATARALTFRQPR